MRLRIVYTDETVAEGSIADWERFRSDGVDAIRIGDTAFYGHALYWLYFEKETYGGSWIFGMASTYVSPPPPETIFRPDGLVSERRLVTMPDLRYASVKLGWWKRPTPEKPYKPGAGKI